jgi:hypothetical protein
VSAGKLMLTKRWMVVTGGRYYRDKAHVFRVLEEEEPDIVVQGDYPDGADLLAKRWCHATGTPCVGMEALFDFYGKPGGPIRNGWMLDFFPIYKVLAFPGNRGTNNCVEQAYRREILVRDERHPLPDPPAISGDGREG